MDKPSEEPSVIYEMDRPSEQPIVRSKRERKRLKARLRKLQINQEHGINAMDDVRSSAPDAREMISPQTPTAHPTNITGQDQGPDLLADEESDWNGLEDAPRPSIEQDETLEVTAEYEAELVEGMKELRGEMKEMGGEMKEMREEVKEMRGDMKVTGAEMQEIRADMKEVRGDINGMGGEIKEMGGIVTQMQGNVQDITEMMKQVDLHLGKMNQYFETAYEERLKTIVTDAVDNMIKGVMDAIANGSDKKLMELRSGLVVELIEGVCEEMKNRDEEFKKDVKDMVDKTVKRVVQYKIQVVAEAAPGPEAGDQGPVDQDAADEEAGNEEPVYEEPVYDGDDPKDSDYVPSE